MASDGSAKRGRNPLSSPAAECCAALFAKPPVAGRCKSRLARAIGEEKAAALAAAFAEDGWLSLCQVPWVRPVIATTEHHTAFEALRPVPEVWLQGSGDLGSRITRIARRALVDHGFFYALGADSPGLPLRLLEEAREALRTHDAVLGPAKDGGFFLFGLRTCPSGLLDHVPWSCADTLAATEARLLERGLSVARTESWFDIDTVEDLRLLRRMKNELSLPATRQLLESYTF